MLIINVLNKNISWSLVVPQLLLNPSFPSWSERYFCSGWSLTYIWACFWILYAVYSFSQKLNSYSFIMHFNLWKDYSLSLLLFSSFPEHFYMLFIAQIRFIFKRKYNTKISNTTCWHFEPDSPNSYISETKSFISNIQFIFKFTKIWTAP